MTDQFISAIIVAAGSSTRMGDGIDKQMVMLGAMPVLAHSLSVFERCAAVDEIVVVTKGENIMDIAALAEEFGFQKLRTVVTGGDTRQKSVQNGVEACSKDANFYIIHDGARPFVSDEAVSAVIESALIHGAAATGVMVKDTVKRVAQDMRIEETIDRSTLYLVQTPQMFRADTYRMAIKQAQRIGLDLTDDCQLFERTGHVVYMCPGEYSNIKITTPEDIAVARAMMRWDDTSF